MLEKCSTLVVPYVEPIFNQMITVSQKILEFFFIEIPKVKTKNKKLISYESKMKSLLLRCLNFVAVLSDQVGSEYTKIESSSHLSEILKLSVQIDSHEVKMFVFCCLGDIARTAPQLIADNIDTFLGHLTQNLVVYSSEMDPGCYFLSMGKSTQP